MSSASEENSSIKNKVKVTVLTGFLGSGKTTLLNWILSAQHGKKIAVIENEFGEIGIDGLLIDTAVEVKSTNEKIIQMSNGCVCCTVRGDLLDAFRALKSQSENENFSWDGIILETTGMADPGPVCDTFYSDEDIEDWAELDCVVTVVDAKYIIQRLDVIQADDIMNESAVQIAFADRILLNKIDLISADELVDIEKRIKKLNPIAKIIRTNLSKGCLDLGEILNVGAFDVEKIFKGDQNLKNELIGTETHGHDHDHEHDHEDHHHHEHEDKSAESDLRKKRKIHDPQITSFSFKFEGDLDVLKLEHWMAKYIGLAGSNLFRYKGVLSVKGFDKKYVFQGVHQNLEGMYMQKEWQPNEKRENRAVFIGKHLNRELLEQDLRNCIALPLRFNIGDRVLCLYESDEDSEEDENIPLKRYWIACKIVELWCKGSPYRVTSIDDENYEMLVHADTNNFIRRIPPVQQQQK